MFIWAGDSGRSLLTGGRCSEVAVSTGLTVLKANFSEFLMTCVNKGTFSLMTFDVLANF